MSYPPQWYYYQGQGQGPMAGPGRLPGYPPYVVYGMPGGEMPGQGAFAPPPPGYYAAAPQPPPSYYAQGFVGPTGAYAPPLAPPTPGSGATGFFNFGNEHFVTGILVAAAVTFLLTNETVQRAAGLKK